MKYINLRVTSLEFGDFKYKHAHAHARALLSSRKGILDVMLRLVDARRSGLHSVR